MFITAHMKEVLKTTKEHFYPVCVVLLLSKVGPEGVTGGMFIKMRVFIERLWAGGVGARFLPNTTESRVQLLVVEAVTCSPRVATFKHFL